MDNQRLFQTISEFLALLRHAKGPVGAVALRAYHWTVDAGTRDVGTRKKVINAAAGPRMEGASGEVPVQAVSAARRGQYDGALQLGEHIEFTAVAPRGGFVHLFDFGTSGTVLKLGPSKEHTDNRVEAGVEFKIPSQNVCPLPNGMPWQVTRPTTAESGAPERLLALITQEDVGLQIEHLHPQLLVRARDLHTRSVKPAPRGGFGSAPKADVPLLFQMPPEQYDYGLIELDVV